MKADAQTEAAVMAVLDEFNNPVATRNLDKVLDLFKSDSDVFLLGSEAGESATGPQELESFFRRVFSRHVAFSWTWKEWIVSAKGQVAWVALDTTVHMSSERGVKSAHPIGSRRCWSIAADGADGAQDGCWRSTTARNRHRAKRTNAKELPLWQL